MSFRPHAQQVTIGPDTVLKSASYVRSNGCILAGNVRHYGPEKRLFLGVPEGYFRKSGSELLFAHCENTLVYCLPVYY